MKNLSPPLLLLSVLAFLLPVIGGQLANDAVALEPGFFPTLAAFHGLEIAGLQHFLLTLIGAAALITLVVKRHVLQVPHAWILGSLVCFEALILLSLLPSHYRWNGAANVCEWLSYGVILLGVVGGAGRKAGPVVILSAFVLGCVVTALFGLLEYSSMKAIDPSWRIFGGWYNPNALAGILLVGFVLALSLFALQSNLRIRMLYGLGLLLLNLALLLTGSKGGLLCTVIALVTFSAIAGFYAGTGRKASLTAAAIGLAMLVVLGLGLKISSPSGSSLGRVTGGGTSEQSAGFRTNLWKGAAALIKANPIGHGAGSYGPLSAKPGITTRTELTHSTPLQVAVEYGVQTVIACLLLLIAWAIYMFRGMKAMPSEVNILKAGVIAAVVATLANGLLESNLYYYGIGASLFLLLGIGLQLSADGVAPEFTFKGMRLVLALVATVSTAWLFYFGFVGKEEANARYLASAGNIEGAKAKLDLLKGVAPGDPEAWYRAGLLNRSVADIRMAVKLSPSAKYLRALARLLLLNDQVVEAEDTLRAALALDPNNLSTNYQMIEVLDRKGDIDGAKAQAERMLLIEEKPYFKIRSLPEEIPTETFRARVYLTRFSKSPETSLSLLRPAVEGYTRFAEITVPFVKSMGEGGPISLTETEEELQSARQTAQQLIDVGRTAGDSKAIAEGQRALELFEKALAGLK